MCLVIDFGGGTLDVSIVEIENEILKVKALIGEPYLGGQDIDARIMNYFIEECTRQNFEYDIQDPNNLKLLRMACRKAKEALAKKDSYDISPYVNNVDDSKASVKLMQAKLNELCNDIFMKIMNIADRAIGMVKLTSDRIDHVILAGGSTRILRIRQMLEEKFGNGKVKLFDINSNEAVAFGAAIVADAIEKGLPIPLINMIGNE
ncbi:hypothetical protein WR25_19598 [Diploscapter pachys]|uniref:Heat shock protein 70 n=1 Tax=Diploscapter pachys TaxID=2018661 RepID=A0A2A2LI32_9BILA|nr:hypothetical protein WR25_19598 [Diploscapter pachys]